MLSPKLLRSIVSSIDTLLVPIAFGSAPSAEGSQDSGCHHYGVFVSQAAASVGGQSSIFSGGGMPMSQKLMSTTACRSQLPSLIPPGSRSSVRLSLLKSRLQASHTHFWYEGTKKVQR